MKTNKAKRLFWAVMTVLLPMCAAATPATLSIEDFTISAGQTKEMLIDMNNPSDEITLIQFDLRLPAGLSIATEGGEMLIDIAGRTTWRKHSLNANTLGDITRFLLSSSTNAVISGNSGAVISITLTASDNFNGGTIKLENQLLVTPAAVETKPADYSYTIEGSSPVTGEIPINATTFPDENFRNWVLAQSYGQDGVLTETEIAGVVSIDVVEKNIASLKGIEYFIALECLYCYNNQLTTLDLSKNTALTKLSCKKNQLSFLDVTKNTALTEFNCSQNQLTSLDVSKNTALTYLDCGSNLLTSLDVTMNTSLNEFRCNANQLTTLNVSKNTALKSFYCTQNQLVSLDVTKLTALVNFGCGYNRLTSLDVTKNAILGRLWCEDNKLTTLDVSKNIALTMLDCCYNQLTTLDVSKNTALKDLYCNNNQLTTLDVSKNTVLNYLACYDNNMNVMGMGILVESLPANTGTFRVKNLSSSNEQNVITTSQVAAAKAKGWTIYAYIAGGQWVEYDGDAVDIAINATTFPDENFRNWILAQSYGQDGVLTETEIAGVVSIDVVEKNIANLKGVEYFTALTSLACHNNQMTTLDMSQNTALTWLSCAGNQLTTLDLSKNTVLTQLYCDDNQMTTLDVSKNTALTWLSCAGNQLTSLDVSKNTALTSLGCTGNQLTSLDVSKNTALTKLSCDFNQLTSLDVSKNTALIQLYCDDNQLTSLDVSKNTALIQLYCDDNQLTSLDVSKNIALTVLYCGFNQLTSLDVSKNTALMSLFCAYNQLTSLDLSKNTVLTQLYCHYNHIKETEMGNLVESLPANNGKVYVKELANSGEQNVITTTQVAAVKAKGWKVYARDENWNWVEYNGDEPTMEPIETADFSSDIDGGTDLDGNVVGDILYNISSGDGSYNATEGCIVVTTPTDDSAINGQDIFGEDFQNNFTGIVFKVPEGKGTVKVEAQTTGAMVLKVKIGSADPVTMELEGRLKVSFPYNVTEPTYVYIYGGAAASAPSLANAAAAGELKLYGIEVVQGETGISPTLALPQGEGVYYDLSGRRVEHPTKGIYIIDGKKVVIK